MFASDLPPGEWSAILVGEYWPGAGALEVLADAAKARQQSATHLHGYADQLRAISQAHLADQEGATADAARHLFSRGEEQARATAERNGAKRRSYESARQSVAALRETLTQIADNGNTAIRRIQESSAPASAKVAGIVQVITDAQTQARAKTAENAGTVLSGVQTVLDAQGADVSARAFAGSHGVDPVAPRPPCVEALTQQVNARLTTAGADSSAAAGDCGGTPPAPAADRPATDRLSGAAAALSSGAGALAAAAGSAVEASLTGRAEGSSPAAPAAAEPTAPGSTGDSALTGPVALPAADSRPFSPVAAAPATAARSPVFGSPQTPPAPGPSTAPALSRSGLAAALNPSQPTVAASQSALVRRVAALAAPVAPERAVARCGPPARADQLAEVLAAVARQQPEVRWAVGERADGGIVLATDLAGGWIPPAVEIPAGVRLLEPAGRQGDLSALLGDCTTVVAYAPGQRLAPESPTMPRSAVARDVPAVDDLGWELAQATKWRDGLPRLAHTLARAATTGTGWLDSEAGLLREQVNVAAARVLAGYPDALDRTAVGNWQLLATIDALMSGRKDDADYHFAWFRAVSLAVQR